MGPTEDWRLKTEDSAPNAATIRAVTPASRDEGLERVLGPGSAIAVVVGAIVGVGIFFTPSRVAAMAGGPGAALAAWALGGLVAMAGGLAFAELGGLYPTTGGQYLALRDAYGRLPAFLYVVCNATAVQAGAVAIIAIVAAQNLGVAATGAVPAAPVTMAIAVALIALLSIANGAGVRWGAAVQNTTTIAKVATLAAVTLLAVVATPDAPPADAMLSTEGSFFAALVPVLFSFGGWQQALWVGGEVRDARRQIPRAIVLGVLVVVALYLAANWAYLALLGWHGVATSKALAADAVGRVWPTWGARAVAGAVALSAFGVLNAQLLTGPRLVLGMARDGLFFPPFARVHPRFATPLASIALIGGLGLLLLLAAGEHGVDRLLTGVVLVDAVFFALTGAAVLVLRRRRPDADRPVRVHAIVPALFVAGEIAVIYGSFRDPAVQSAALVGVAWVVGAFLLWLVFFRRA
jgi:basic amino acid/polyamine antiporter, APA family